MEEGPRPMLALYLSCLVVGGVFVALSVFAGGESDSGGADKELAGGHDFDTDMDHDVGLGADTDLDHDVGLGADTDLDHGHGLAFDPVDSPDVSEVGLADASQGGVGRRSATSASGRRKVWLPFLSFRFWTFGAAFFGLTGATLTGLALTAEPLTLGLSLALGGGVGTLTSTLVHVLRKPVSPETIRATDFRGQTGELVMPLRPGGTTKIKVQVTHVQRELLAVAEDPVALPRGTRVVITGFDDQGRAQIVTEQSLYTVEDEPLEEEA